MNELEHFRIGNRYGGHQNWFADPAMKLGGCAAVTACDCCIHLARQGRRELYPFDAENPSREDYLSFAMDFKPYFRPRVGGINTVQLYADGLKDYLSDRDIKGMDITCLNGGESYEKAENILIESIDENVPVPFLLLRHEQPEFADYEWHWFLLNGYKRENGELFVKAVTYGDFRWLDFKSLWNGMQNGGLVRISI